MIDAKNLREKISAIRAIPHGARNASYIEGRNDAFRDILFVVDEHERGQYAKANAAPREYAERCRRCKRVCIPNGGIACLSYDPNECSFEPCDPPDASREDHSVETCSEHQGCIEVRKYNESQAPRDERPARDNLVAVNQKAKRADEAAQSLTVLAIVEAIDAHAAVVEAQARATRLAIDVLSDCLADQLHDLRNSLK